MFIYLLYFRATVWRDTGINTNIDIIEMYTYNIFSKIFKNKHGMNKNTACEAEIPRSNATMYPIC